MKKRCLLGTMCFLSAFLPLSAEKIVQCIANFDVNVEHYNRVLQEHGYDAKVVAVNIKDYEPDLLVRKGKFHQLLRLLHIDYPWKVRIPENVDKIVFFNVPPKAVKKYDLSRFPKDKLVLFMWEPETVLRGMYLPHIQDCFSKIYTWNDALVDGKTRLKFHYPVLTPMLENLPSYEEKKLCTLVASDLSSKSQNELYSQRKEAILYFERANEEGFEFYGRRWDPSQYKNYKGSIGDKLGTIKNYRFSICYENTHGTPGYITEKIFDCFAAGTVPIYWGASNVEDYIPKDCFIDRRDFASMEELHLFVKSMPKEIYEGYLTRIRTFLSSEVAERFSGHHFYEDFYQSIVN